MQYVVGVSTDIPSKKNPYVQYVVGVITDIPSKKKPYVQYVVGVITPIPVQATESFSYTLLVVGVATAIGQFAECQSADFERLMRATLPTEPLIYV